MKKEKPSWKYSVLHGVLLIALFAGLYFLWSENQMVLQRDLLINQPYLVKQADDGSIFIIDSGHERVLHLEEDGQFIWSADLPLGNAGIALYADDVVSDESGTTYIQVSDWDGMHIDRELFLIYDSHGKLINTIEENAYDCGTVNKYSRFGLRAEEGSVSYLQADESGLSIVHPGKPSEFISYPNANVRTADAIIDGDSILLLDKNGTINRLSGNTKEVLYDAALEKETNRIPYHMAMAADGSIFFTDIRSRTIQQLTDDPAVSVSVVSDTDTLTVQAGRDGQLLMAEQDYAAVGDSALTQWYWGAKISAIRLLGLILTVAFVVLSLGFLIKLLPLMWKIHLTGAQRTSLLLIVCVTSAVVLVCVKLFGGFQATYREKLQEELEVTAYMVAGVIEGDDIASINTAADFDGVHYKNLIDKMNWAFDADVEVYSQIYCNILRVDENENAWAVAYYDQSIGTYFPLEESEVEEALEVVRTKRTVWNEGASLINGAFCYVKVPVFGAAGSVTGVVEVGTVTTVLENMIADMSRQLLMTLLVLVLLIVLAVSELMSYTNAEERFTRRKTTGKYKDILPGHLVRLLVFLMFTAYNLSSSFLPVYILHNVEGWNFRDSELMASLPITLNIFFIGSMALCCTGLLKKMRIRTLTVVSALFSMTGNLLIFLFPSYPVILLGMGLDGIGMGLVSNAVYVLLSRIGSEKMRLEGFAIYNAACISGINFGMMLGSILAASFTQHIVFACAAVLWLGVVSTSLAVDRYTSQMMMLQEETAESSALSLKQFLLGKGVLPFMVLIQNPYILFNSFAYYFVPLYCEEMGYGETTVSLLLMVYSLFAVYLSDVITRNVDRYAGRYAMYFALGLNISAVILFGQLQTVPAMVIALVLMGLSASFGKSVQQNYFMQMPPVRAYGEDRAIGVYNFTENIGESLGPTVFGKMAAFAPRGLAFSGFGGIIAIISSLHFMLFRKGKGE